MESGRYIPWHAPRQVVLQQAATYMVGRPLVAQNVSRAGRLTGNLSAVIVAGVAARAEDAHHGRLVASGGAAGGEHVGLDMYIACSKGFSEPGGHLHALGRETAAGTVEVN